MGLDISTHKRVELVRAMTVQEYNASEEWQNKIDDTWRDPEPLFLLYQDSAFMAQCDGLEQGVYRGVSGHGFCAGSYSGYNFWRDHLAKFAGHGSAESVWHNSLTGPFCELINFSDCEGFIGPVTSAKLAKDFRDNLARAEADEHDDGYWVSKYRDWLKAFEEAAGGGVVDFG
jgi:hypothetical protein